MVDEDAEMRALFAAASFDASLEQLAPLFAAAFSDGAQPLLARDTSAAAGAASPALQLLAVALYAVHAIAQVRFTRASQAATSLYTHVQWRLACVGLLPHPILQFQEGRPAKDPLPSLGNGVHPHGTLCHVTVPLTGSSALPEVRGQRLTEIAIYGRAAPPPPPALRTPHHAPGTPRVGTNRRQGEREERGGLREKRV